jgi:hypothetical protein
MLLILIMLLILPERASQDHEQDHDQEQESFYAKKRSGDRSGCGLQMRATQCSQLSWPLRISISTRKK